MKGRSIAAVFVGIIVGLLVALLFNPVFEKLYPVDHEAMKELGGNRSAIAEYIRNLPAGFHLLGIAKGVVRLLVGLFVGSLIEKGNLMVLIVISAFSLLLAVLDLFAFPHPIWYGFVYIPVVILATIAFIYAKKKA